MNNYEQEILTQLLSDKQTNKGYLTEGMANEIKKLWNTYKKSEVCEGDTILCVEAGMFGHVEIRRVDKLSGRGEKVFLKYLERGDYEYVSIETKSDRTILWTDYSTTQPFNRQTPFYMGFDFRSLNLSISTGKYREYYIERGSNVSFPVYGFDYNPSWDMVRMSICMRTESVTTFMRHLRKILGKESYDTDKVNVFKKIRIRREKSKNKTANYISRLRRTEFITKHIVERKTPFKNYV